MTITETQIWKMLDAWYALIGRRIEPSATERLRDFATMKRAIEAFEREHSADRQGQRE